MTDIDEATQPITHDEVAYDGDNFHPVESFQLADCYFNEQGSERYELWRLRKEAHHSTVKVHARAVLLVERGQREYGTEVESSRRKLDELHAEDEQLRTRRATVLDRAKSPADRGNLYVIAARAQDDEWPSVYRAIAEAYAWGGSEEDIMLALRPGGGMWPVPERTIVNACGATAPDCMPRRDETRLVVSAKAQWRLQNRVRSFLYCSFIGEPYNPEVPFG